MRITKLFPVICVALLAGCGKNDSASIDAANQVKSQSVDRYLSKEQIPQGTWIANRGHCRQELVLDGMHEFFVSGDSVSSFGITLNGRWVTSEPFAIDNSDEYSCLALNKERLVFGTFSQNGLHYQVAFDPDNQVLIRKTNSGAQWFTPLDSELLRSFTVVTGIDLEDDDGVGDDAAE